MLGSWTNFTMAASVKILEEGTFKVVHGHNDKKVAEKLYQVLINQASLLYKTYKTSPDFILPHHQYLFSSCTLSQCLQMDMDSLTCWTWLVEAAKLALGQYDNLISEQSMNSFAPYYATGKTTFFWVVFTSIWHNPSHSDVSASSDSSYMPSHQSDTSFTYMTSSMSSFIQFLSQYIMFRWQYTTFSLWVR